MKRYRKRELLEMITSLEEANSYIEKTINRESSLLIELLALCQKMAISMGDHLEAQGEKGCALMKILEDYCENLFQMSCVLADPMRCKRLGKRIKKQLNLLANGIHRKLPPDKKEIVFLPYKVSMWDSMESIWKAAEADENCEVYVVPIPYFDRNADGSFGKMHCEANEYPDYVSVTAWETYDIVQRKPDVIYIHNPYDGNNRVTSVYPCFYAKELKQHTNMLVYIPYFVAINNQVEEHFCVLPGTIYADRVIVQSEEVRQVYIEQFHFFEEENKCQGAFGRAEEKFVALGSPKFDKVIMAKREDFQIPALWKNLIQKPDGKRKKVVLYNTTIASMLRYKEKMLRKIENVLEKFARQENIVLLWRPHPLLRATLQSMLPALFEEYMRIETQYRKKRFGIYDESSDLYRAIAVSDAYYGDWSSIVELYRKTGKPIMIQNSEVLE